MKLLQATLSFIGFGRLREKIPQTSKDPKLEKLEKQLGYEFQNTALLRQALTHKSSITPDALTSPESWLVCNERLEFLGDSVLNCLMTEHLFHRFIDKDEGHLSKMKSLLVSRKILGDLAVEMGLGAYLILGLSESKTGGHSRVSVQSNAFEALLGALYLDGGMPAARLLLQQTLFKRLDEFVNDENNVNYKSTILEMAQGDGFGVPRYIVTNTSGPDHAKQFSISLEIAGVVLGEGSGENKKKAQQRAAFAALAVYDKEKILQAQGERRYSMAQMGQ